MELEPAKARRGQKVYQRRGFVALMVALVCIDVGWWWFSPILGIMFLGLGIAVVAWLWLWIASEFGKIATGEAPSDLTAKVLRNINERQSP